MIICNNIDLKSNITQLTRLHFDLFIDKYAVTEAQALTKQNPTWTELGPAQPQLVLPVS